MTNNINNETGRLLALLEQHKPGIIIDLEVQDVIPELLEKLVFGHDDKQRVEHEKTYEERATVLLDLIRRKAETGNHEAIPAFITSLKEKYSWLYLKLTQDVLDHGSTLPLPLPRNNNVDEERRIRRLLEAGGVHGLPSFTIERTEYLDSIRTALSSLDRNYYLVLTGMTGCGKSVLGMQALHSKELVTHSFKDGIYWVSIGKECSESKDAILTKMRSLCDKVGETRAPSNLEAGAEFLRAAFLKRPDSLLVLDDVWRSEVIRAFDIGCRTMIITRDTSVMDIVPDREHIKTIKIADGLTDNESLELFCQCLGTTLANLPEEAHAIHDECKGSPMVISLISALFHGHDVTDKGRWNHYLDFLRKRKFDQMRQIRGYEHDNIFDAIALSIENLDVKDREYYSDFALFQDDVGVPCQVLMTLWGLSKYEVEDIMSRMVRKSLAAEEIDPQRKTKIYSVHDLLLDYLKYQLSSEEGAEKKLHEKLVNQYLRNCGAYYEKLPDDGYIHSFIGYHLYKADMIDLFPKIYLNLLFLGEKMRTVGAADLLTDLRKYKEFILENSVENESTNFLEEITTFAQSTGHRIYNQPDTDVVQLALELPHLTRIYKQAKEIARRTSNRLYLEWSNATSDQWKNAEAVVLCTDNVRFVKFVDGNHFLAGLTNGCIELCNLPSCRICHVYCGHSDAVQVVDVYGNQQDGNLAFVSGSDDKTCKLWTIKWLLEKSWDWNKHSQNSEDSSPSPKIRPDFWSHLNKSKDESFLTFGFHTAPIMYSEFSPNGSKVVSTSLNEVLIWSTEDGRVLQKISPELPSSMQIKFQACHFGRNGQREQPYFLMSCETRVFLYAAQSPRIFSSVEGHHLRIVALIQLPNETFCTVSENEIGLWKVSRSKAVTKARRTRSVSPRRPFSLGQRNSLPQNQNGHRKTQVDAIPLDNSTQKKTDEFLHPNTLMLARNSSSSYSSDGRDSPTQSQSSDYCSPASDYTFIDTPDGIIEMRLVEVFSKKGPGLFHCAAATDCGEILACGTSDRKVILWNLVTRNYLAEFTSHNGNLICLDFSKLDPWALLSGSEDHTVMMWDLEEEVHGKKEPQKNLTFSSVFIDSPNTMGYFISIFSTDKNSIQIYKDNKCLIDTVPSGPGAITASAIRKDGLFAVLSNEFGNLYQVKLESILKNEETPTNLLRLMGSTDKEKISHLAFNDGGDFFVAATVEGNVLVFQDFNLARTVKFESKKIVNLHFPFDTLLGVICQENRVLWIETLENGEQLRGWKADEPLKATCSTVGRNDDGRAPMAIGTMQDGILIFNLAVSTGALSGTRITCRHNTSTRSLQFSGDILRLAVGHDNGLITIWKYKGAGYEEEKDLVFHKSRVRALAFSPDDKWLVSCGDKLAFWTFEKSTPPQPLLKPPTFIEERRRKKSGDNSSRPNSRLSLEIAEGTKIGRKGKRELLQSFFFRGAYAQNFVTDPYFRKFTVVDDIGIFYIIDVLSNSLI